MTAFLMARSADLSSSRSHIFPFLLLHSNQGYQQYYMICIASSQNCTLTIYKVKVCEAIKYIQKEITRESPLESQEAKFVTIKYEVSLLAEIYDQETFTNFKIECVALL